MLSFSGDEDSCEYGSAKFYALCGLGGVMSCGITHTALVPLDLIKCRYGELTKNGGDMCILEKTSNFLNRNF